MEMGLGKLYVVPKGVSHRPVAWNAQILLIKKTDTFNTSSQATSEQMCQVEDMRSMRLWGISSGKVAIESPFSVEY